MITVYSTKLNIQSTLIDFLFAIFKSSALETFHQLDSETLTIAVAIMLEKIDLKIV